MNPTIRQHLLSTFPEFASSADAHLFDPESPIWDMEMPYTVPSPKSIWSIKIPNHHMPHRDLVYYLVALAAQKDRHHLDTRPVWKTILQHLDITWCWLVDHEVEELLSTHRVHFVDLFPPNVWRDPEIQSMLRAQLLRIFQGKSGQTIDDLYEDKNLYQWLVLMHHYIPFDQALHDAFQQSIAHLSELDAAMLHYALGLRGSIWKDQPIDITEKLETHVVTRYFPIETNPLFFDGISMSIRHAVLDESYDFDPAANNEVAELLRTANEQPIVSLEGYSRFCAAVAFFYPLGESPDSDYQERYRACFARHPDGSLYQQHVENCAKLRLDPLLAVESWKTQHAPDLDASSVFEP